MKKNICIIDYGIGNLLSIERSIEKLGYEAKISNNKCDFRVLAFDLASALGLLERLLIL